MTRWWVKRCRRSTATRAENGQTIESIAGEVGLSRSAFAAHFTRFVGEPPLRYITKWRMQLAQNWLHETTTAVGDIADQLGYSSEDAFKREVGVPPGAYRKGAGVDQLIP